MEKQLNKLCPNPPKPTGDGACNHLDGMKLPNTAIPSNDGGLV